MNNIREMMRKFTVALNSIDEAYCSNTKRMGVKESELWLLYALDDDDAHSQKQICEEWGFPKTTLNTAIKQAEAAGHLTMTHIPGKRREMNVCLTEEGKAYAKQVLSPIYAAEKMALEATIRRYSIDFIEVLDYFGACLKSALEDNMRERKEPDR
ncbi:MarR family winged helix-turn-helix transcriptional regulator [Eubacteriales bacterium DFI.9.88]|nr:MarR family winged helix-turn-helix transcriptional regulator [Eubacteriales bacterium DFI.9.88]